MPGISFWAPSKQGVAPECSIWSFSGIKIAKEITCKQGWGYSQAHTPRSQIWRVFPKEVEFRISHVLGGGIFVSPDGRKLRDFLRNPINEGFVRALLPYGHPTRPTPVGASTASAAATGAGRLGRPPKPPPVLQFQFPIPKQAKSRTLSAPRIKPCTTSSKRRPRVSAGQRRFLSPLKFVLLFCELWILCFPPQSEFSPVNCFYFK